MTCRGVVFDLDGTLLDTLDDIAAAANRALAAMGFPGHDRDAFRWFVGDGSAMLMTRALPESQRTPETIGSGLQAFLKDYNLNWRDTTHPYEGIFDLLNELVRRRIPMAVVTNKPHMFAENMVGHFFADLPFNPVLGQREGVPRKPDPAQALSAVRIMGVAPRECIFLGDSAVDMETARRAGMIPLGAGWGFRPAAELLGAGASKVIVHPMELLTFLNAQCAISGSEA